MKKLLVFVLLLILASNVFSQRTNDNNWGSDNVQTIKGVVTDNQRPCGFLKADDDNSYRIHLGPVWFWNQNNYVLALADAIIKGNVKIVNGEYNIYPQSIEQSGTTMSFTDDKGMPKWSGGKRGNGNGQGCCYGRGNGYGQRNGECDGTGKGNGRGYGRGSCPYNSNK